MKNSIGGWMDYCAKVKIGLGITVLTEVQCKYLMTQYTSNIPFTDAVKRIENGDSNVATETRRNRR